MLIKIIKKYYISLVFLLILIFNVIGSHWTQELFPLSISLSRINTVCIYFPFLLEILNKLIFDIKSRQLLTDRINILYYVFGVYFVLISAWRFFTNGEYKESVYLFIVLMGVLSFCINVLLHQKYSHAFFTSNVILCSAFLVLYRVIYFIIGYNYYSYSPINTNILVSAILLLLVNHFFILLDSSKTSAALDKKKRRIKWIIVLIIFSLIIIIISGSRASFLLLLLTIVFCATSYFVINRKPLKQLMISLLTSVIMVALLFMLNVQDVRGMVVREIGWLIPSISQSVVIEDVAISQEEQAERSDIGRKELMELGINEIKKNPILGTGNVFYEQKISDSYTANQSSHCFIIEFLVSFGLVGTFLCALLLLVMLFRIINRKPKITNIYLMYTVFVFFAFSLVQPVFFNTIVLYIFGVETSYYITYNEKYNDCEV